MEEIYGYRTHSVLKIILKKYRALNKKTVDVMGIYVIISSVYATGNVEVHNINPISHVA